MTSNLVRRLPIENGVSGWETISQRLFPLKELDGNVSADWLVIGAGFAGLSAARRLRALRPGEKIVLLDAGEIGKGTSGRHLRSDPHSRYRHIDQRRDRDRGADHGA
ncbi:hypothetical protein ASE04_04655 [Rhizobium sp. Root708]|nr:hypothetical protein ASE04_04655 [Rhizobium sp. Root708]